METTDKIRINANLTIWVKLKDLGIEHYVIKHNAIMPFQMHTSFKEYKKRANEFGYHEFQIWDFLDIFGNLGMRGSNHFHLDFVFNKKDCEDVILTQSGEVGGN
jgi:hypothetical protein